MQFVLMEVSGLAQAIMTLKMSKRNWSMDMHEHICKVASVLGMGIYELSDIVSKNARDILKA